MGKVKEYFAGTDIIDRFGKSPTPVPKNMEGHHRPFGYYQGILYVGERGTSLMSIVTKDGIKGHTKGWEVPGKIYDKHKVIYFSEAPKRMTSFLRELEQTLSFTMPVIISPDWTIKIKNVGTFKLDDYNKRSTPKIRYSTKEGRIKLTELLDEAMRLKKVAPPIGSDKEPPVPSADELTDSIIDYSKGTLNPNVMKKRILKYKLLGGSLEGIFHIIRKKVEPSTQRDVMRDLQNYYLEGPKFSRSGWRRNDLRETYGVGALQLRGSDNSIYVEVENSEFIKIGILDKFSNIRADAWVYADEIDKLVQYLEQAKKDLEEPSRQKYKISNLRQGF